MKSIILYGSHIKLTIAHRLVTGFFGQPNYFVRAALFNGDICKALDNARPMPDETVLNTVPVVDNKQIHAPNIDWDEMAKRVGAKLAKLTKRAKA